jgi:hypothetical protein
MPGAGSEASQVLTNFAAVQELVRDDERLVDIMQRRGIRAQDLNTASGDYRGPYAQIRAPMIITSESFAAQGRYIIFWSGPENTQWNFPMRAAQEKTRSGTILHLWRNSSRSTFFDEPTVQFTFQTGNLLPVRTRTSGEISGQTFTADAIDLPPGLLDFYDFFDLMNEEKILADGRPNFTYIVYHSLVYPEIFLRGFFNPEGLQFGEQAEDPAKVNWTATFTVRSTEPPFYSGRSLYSAWRSALAGNSLSLSDE